MPEEFLHVPIESFILEALKEAGGKIISVSGEILCIREKHGALWADEKNPANTMNVINVLTMMNSKMRLGLSPQYQLHGKVLSG